MSVVIPCLDLGAFLPEAVQSVLESTTPSHDMEIVVVDDGSTDEGTVALFRQMESRTWPTRLRIVHQANRGLSEARNTGIRASSGRFILPLDADDRIRPGFIEKAAAILAAEPGVGAVYGYAARFGLDDGTWTFPEFDARRILLENCIPACALMRRRVWEDCGGFDPAMVTHEDWEFWINASRHGWSFRLVREVAFDYRAREGSLVTQGDRPEVCRAGVAHLVTKHHDLFAQHLPYVVAERELAVREMREIVRKQQTHITEQERLRADLEKRVEERDLALAEHGRVIREQDRLLAEHGRALQERIDFIEKVTVAFRQKEEQLQAVEQRLATCETELRAIHATRWWRLASWWARVRGPAADQPGSPSRQ